MLPSFPSRYVNCICSLLLIYLIIVCCGKLDYYKNVMRDNSFIINYHCKIDSDECIAWWPNASYLRARSEKREKKMNGFVNVES